MTTDFWRLMWRKHMPTGVFYLLSTPERAIAVRHDLNADRFTCYRCPNTVTCAHVEFAKRHHTDEMPTFDARVSEEVRVA